MSAVEFFKQYDENTAEQCMRYMRYIHLEKDEVVFHIGKIFDNCQ